MIRCVSHLNGFNAHFFEVTQAVDPATRQPDFFTVVPGSFKLAKFSADHLVTRPLIASDVDTANKSPSAGISLDRDVDAVVAAVHRGFGLRSSKSEAEVRKIIRERFGGLRYLIGVIGLTRLDLDKRLEFVLLLQIIAHHRDLGDNKAFALGDIDGDHNFLLVRRDRNLGGIDLELQIAFGQVIGAQGLQIRVQFAPDVAVGLGVPAQPGTRIQVK